MTIPGLIIVNMLVGASIAYGAKIQIHNLQRPIFSNRYFTALLMLEVSIFLPIGMYFSSFYPDWSWMYLLDTKSIQPGLNAMILAAYPISAVAGYLVSHFSAKSNTSWISIMFMIFLSVGFFALLVVGYDKLSHLGTFDQYHNNVNLTATSASSLMPSAIITWVGATGVWGYIIYRFWHEGRLTSAANSK